jgi:hypothetical protein
MAYNGLIRSLGYKVVKRLRPQGYMSRYTLYSGEYVDTVPCKLPTLCRVYKVKRDGQFFTVKLPTPAYCGGREQYEQSLAHVIRENEVLQAVAGVDGIPKRIGFHELQEGTLDAVMNFLTRNGYRKNKVVALVKEYIEGWQRFYEPEYMNNGWMGDMDVARSKGIDIEQNAQVLFTAAHAIHAAGYVGVFSGEGVNPERNVITTPTGKPYIVDLGNVVREDEIGKEEFQKHKDLDERALDHLAG